MTTDTTKQDVGATESLPPRSVSLLRQRDFQLLLAGKLISTCGDMFYVVALPFLVFSVGGGITTLTTALTAFGLARVATALPAGALVDRVGPRPVMVGADIIRAVAVLGVAASLSGDRSTVALIAAALLLGAGEGCFQPASQSMTPSLVPDDKLPAANALSISANLIAAAVSPAIGGIGVVALSPITMLLLDAATFGVSILTLLLIRGGRRVEQARIDAGDAGQVRTVREFLRQSALFRVILLMMGVFGLSIAGTLEVALPLLSTQRADLGATGYGLLMSALGAGWLLGALAAGRLARVPGQGLLVVGLLGIDAVLLAAMPWAPGQMLMMAMMLLLGLSDGALLVIVLTVLQRLPPPHLRGRVLGVLAFVDFAMYPVSAAIAGAVLSHSPVSTFFVITGIGVGVVALIGLASPVVRAVRPAQPDQADRPAAVAAQKAE